MRHRTSHGSVLGRYRADSPVNSRLNVVYKRHTVRTIQTEEFKARLRTLRDVNAKAKIIARIHRLEIGNPGDVAPVGEGVSETKIN